MAKIGEIYTGLPGWGKAVVIIAAIGIPTVAGIAIYKGYKKREDAKKTTGNVAGHDLDLLAQAGIVPNYIHTQYLTWADEIQTALDSCGVGDPQATVINVFSQMKNEADVAALVEAFGDRVESPCWYSHPFNTFVSIFKDYPARGLSKWLQLSLSADNFDAINQILRNNGINFSWK